MASLKEAVAEMLTQPLDWPYQVYNCFTLVLSCAVLMFVLVIHEMSMSASILPHAFQMVTLRKRRMYCFEVDISSGPAARKVRMQYVWLLRTAVLVVGCYLWQTCVLSYWAFDFRDASGKQNLVSACQNDGADCFGTKHNFDFFSVNASPTNLCVKYDLAATLRTEVQEEISSQYRYVTCINFVKPNTLTYTQHLAIAYALAKMIITLFEVLVWLLYRSRSSLLPTVVLAVGIVFLAVWVGSIFIPRLLSFFSSWIGYVMLLSVPIVLWTALLAAHFLRKIQHQKWTLWQIQANRPMARAEDPDNDFRHPRSNSLLNDTDYRDDGAAPPSPGEQSRRSVFSPRQSCASPVTLHTSSDNLPSQATALEKRTTSSVDFRPFSGSRFSMPTRYQLAKGADAQKSGKRGEKRERVFKTASAMLRKETSERSEGSKNAETTGLLSDADAHARQETQGEGAGGSKREDSKGEVEVTKAQN
ncbi:conserved hypothetical protein [Neospora caninum Liverpool]|uniref:Transmembrane protein n=1 Tax=Neospora caninum (strain Liverpool) TaxID=572307 RepID=F0VI11_NEOCL|nr:conserved hypothetical protein [Neospora caninum Liverpool]CBZ53372.1 conserved hypothetical protein [Neospora caninum Liverpool]CEL67358.1 TPA: hypothetical protein BN1204_031590 [Neospora caninum Liverpool]|eukprot:XP_003883404.1 conserved hypothetical protein [Neospora caninum Liverpool]